MFLFQENRCAEIWLKNTNPYVRLAVEDLRKDFLKVSFLNKSPVLSQTQTDGCLIIEENSETNGDPLLNESFSIVCDGKNIQISAPTYLGTMWGIYTFSEKILGIQPCYLFNDFAIEKRISLEVGKFSIQETPQKPGFRGIFINDEDLLTGWKESGGVRHIYYPFYQTTVSENFMDMAV